MSQRVFYIVHLDKSRIASLAVIITGLLLTAFATGYRTGNTAEPTPAYSQSHDIFSESENKVSEKSDYNSIESEDPLKPEDSSVDLLASKEIDTPPKQRVNLLDSALDSDLDLQPSAEISRKSERKTDSTTKTKISAKESIKKEPTKKEVTKKDSPKKEITKKPTKKTKITAKDTNKQPTTSIPKNETKQEIYVLQMGAYQSREAALRLSDQIRKHGIQTYVLKTGNIHTVRTEAVSDRRQLFQTEKKLKSLRFSPITVMLKENN